MTNQIAEQAVHDKGKAASATTRQRKKLPWYKRDVDAWWEGTLGMSYELQGFYSACLDAMWRLSGPLPSDISQLALLLRGNVRVVRRLLADLIKAGKILRTPTGFINKRMMSEIADAGKAKATLAPAPAAPDRQLNFDDLIGNEANSFPTSEAKYPEVSTRALDPDPDLDSESKKDTPLPPEEPPPPDKAEPVHRFDLVGMGLGGSPSPEARRRVCAQLAIGNADPLVALYELWPQSRRARDADALFVSTAPKLYRDAAPEVRQACSPAGLPAPDIVPLPPVRASASLVAHLNRGRRHGLHAH